jgi:class 3 adenylate cyclase/tetratricopeptide (TPR) repeat protein
VAAIALADSSGDQPRPDSATSLPNPLGTAGDSGRLADVGDGQPVGAIVTLLFTDVVGSTELLDRLGDDAFETLRRTHFAMLRQAVQDSGGHEVKTLGDGLMVVFESATRALDAAVAVQRAVSTHAALHPETAFAVRVGLHTGEPIRDEGDYFGEPVVVAKRLCDSAAGGEIRASRLVVDLAGRRTQARLEELEPVPLKGFGAAMPAVRVLWEEAALPPPPLPVPLAAAVRTGPMANRTEELEHLLSAWSDASAGSPRMVFLAGEPGIGKTRLAAEIAQVVSERDGVVALGGCDEDLGVPYQPFVEALRGLSAHQRTQPGLPVELTRLVPELAPAAAASGQAVAVRVDPETERHRLFEGVVSVLSAVAATRPLLLVLDDVQWAAKPTLLLLRHLLRSASAQRLLVIATYRHTEVDRRHPLAAMLADLRRDHSADRILLRGLDKDSVTALVRATAGHELDSDATTLASALHDETDGNPFFIGEVLRHLTETGAVYQSEGRWTSDLGTIGQLGLPESVREVIGRRLSRLSDAANGVLRVSAVMGPTFSPLLLAGLPDVPSDPDALFDALDEAQGAGVVVESGTSYAFAHDLVRQTLLSELSAARRGRLHRRIGEALEAMPDQDVNLAALAHHFAEAREPAKAAEYANRAGRRAIEHLAYEEAVDLLERGLEVMEHERLSDPALRTDLLLTLASALERLNEMDRVREVALRAADDAEAAGDVALLGQAALLLLSEGIVTVGSQDAAPAVVGEKALVALGQLEPALRARLLAGLARHAVLARGDVARATDLADEAWTLATASGEEPAIAAALMARGLTLEGSPNVQDRLALYDELVRRAEGTDTVLSSQGRSLRTRANLELGNLDAVDADIAALERSEEPWWFSRTIVAIHQAARAMLEGRLDEVEEPANESLMHGGKDPDVANGWAAQICLLRREQGRLAEIVAVLAQAVEDNPGLTAFRVGLALAYAESGQPEAAAAQLDALAADDFAAIPPDSTRTACLALLADVVAILGDRERAAAILELLRPFAGLFVVVAGTGVNLGSVDRHLGMLTSVLGRDDEAEAHYAAALDLEERLGAPSLVARTRDWLGRLRG